VENGDNSTTLLWLFGFDPTCALAQTARPNLSDIRTHEAAVLGIGESSAIARSVESIVALAGSPISPAISAMSGSAFMPSP
jgi:hypothetical protein